MPEIDPCNSDLPASDPELFHYTTFDGLRGIFETQSLWATHYSHLNDSTEVDFVRAALTKPIANHLVGIIKRAQRDKLSILRNVQKAGGLEPASNILATEVLSIVHEAAFGAPHNLPIVADPYITSFCSHAGDELYERSHGLLSQWRGYGGAGGYCIVFDTLELTELLGVESRAHFWSYINIDPVAYSNDLAKLAAYATRIAKGCEDCADVLLNDSRNKNFDALLVPYIQAATHIKHRGFIEEREVRIVVSPITHTQVKASGEAVRSSIAERKAKSPGASFKNIYTWPGTKKRRYVALFENLHKRLPIKRVIVGPSIRQQHNQTMAQKILRDRIELTCSETPFVGQWQEVG